MVDQHPSIETMVRTGTDGLQIPFLALVKLLIVMGCKGIDLPFQIVGSVHGNKISLGIQLASLSNFVLSLALGS